MALLAMDDDGRKMTEMESRQLLRRESVGRASRGSDARGQKEEEDRPKKTAHQCEKIYMAVQYNK